MLFSCDYEVRKNTTGCKILFSGEKKIFLPREKIATPGCNFQLWQRAHYQHPMRQGPL